ncbi:MAG: hypothetical protein ABJA35_04545 [Parafilimonas sp.]
MKLTLITILVVLISACSKQTGNKTKFAILNNSIESRNDTIAVPLNDLGKGTFKDSTGGLYPGGVNKATGQYAVDLLKAAKRINPIDTFGNASLLDGKVVFVSLGGSTGGHNMKQLIKMTTDNPATNPYLKLFTCNNGKTDASLKDISDTASSYWKHVEEVIKGSKSSNRQIQVIYLETDDTSTLLIWPQRPIMVKNDLEACLRVFKQKFENIKLVYVLGRTRTFGTKAIWNKEPSPYYFGWSCKWAIEDQINGVRGTQYKGENAVSPMITWGFYQWADSLPRKTDEFYWRESETADGLHATAIGQDTLATRFQNFLLTDRYASIWYAAH